MAKGVLYLVGVPIGCYEDITLRALNVLKTADIIAAEDTRKAQRLLSHFQIKPPQLLAHHAHNEVTSAKGLLPMLAEGKHIALISDAGMPVVSDPGYHLATQARSEGVEVKIIPGVSAVPTALAASGLPGEDFRFIGFPPRKKGQQEAFFNAIAASPSTLIMFESPKRVVATLRTMLPILGDRQVCLCRELTKTYEEVLPSTLNGLIEILQTRKEVLGEITLVIAGLAKKELNEEDLKAEIQEKLNLGLSAKDVRDALSQVYPIGKKDLYKKILALK